MAVAKGGITSKKKEILPRTVVPNDPENMFRSKAQFVENRRKLREREIKLKEREAELMAGEEAEAPKVETKKRPKKIE